MFLGEYTHTLDKEFRLALPMRLREAASDEIARGLCLTMGTERFILAYTQARLGKLLAALEADPSIGKTAARDFKRAFGATAAIAVPDAQGRIRLPEFLRSHAAIGKQVTVVGVVDAIEIWSAELYSEREPARHAAYERLAPRVLG